MATGVPYETIAADTGGDVQVGIQGFDQIRARNAQARLDRQNRALQNIFQGQLANDPLFAMVIGQAQGAGLSQGFNRRNLFRQASQQIEAVGQRRTTEQLQSLAGFGFEADSPQAKFLQQRLQRTQARQLGTVDQFLAQQQVQSNMLRREDVAQGAGAIASFANLRTGGI